MDEPSEGLAPIVIGQIRDRILALKGGDLSILLVEQNLGLAMRTADRIYLLGEGGRIAWEGTPEQLNADEAAKRRHLGV
jgi:branched-chain amino acid transport system ATP-binding protein